MASINVKQPTRAEYDGLKPGSMTHDEFVHDLLSVYRCARDGGLDEQAIIDAIKREVGPQVELACYRAVKEVVRSE